VPIHVTFEDFSKEYCKQSLDPSIFLPSLTRVNPGSVVTCFHERLCYELAQIAHRVKRLFTEYFVDLLVAGGAPFEL
jgi:hypothetical protein